MFWLERVNSNEMTMEDCGCLTYATSVPDYFLAQYYISYFLYLAPLYALLEQIAQFTVDNHPRYRLLNYLIAV